MKLFHALSASVFLTLTLAACTAEDPINGTAADGPVTFCLKVPGQPGSRAYSDATLADQLSFRIYDVTGGTETMVYEKTVTPSFSTQPNGNRVTNLQVDLANGREYQVVWWAQNSGCKAYSFVGKSVSVDYSEIAHNSDAADAFYAFTPTFKVQGSAQREVTLRRPFAQINFGTSDMAAESAVLAPVYGADYGNLVSKLTITSPLATTLDLTDGTVGGDTDEDITFSYTKPGIDEAFPVAEHKYVGMVYVLAGETGIADLNLTIGNGSQDCTTVSVPSAPIRANFRTNIYGAFLTSPNDFQITLDPNTAGDEEIKVTSVEAASYEDLTKAAKLDNVIVTLTDNIKLDKAVTFRGNTTLIGNGETVISGDNAVNFIGESCVIKGIKFENANAGYASNLVANSGVKNVTIEDCEFSKAKWDGIQITSPEGANNLEYITIRNCKFIGTDKAQKGIHIEPNPNNDNSNIKVTLENLVFENAGTAYYANGTLICWYIPYENYTIKNIKVTGELKNIPQYESIDPETATSEYMAYWLSEYAIVFSVGLVGDSYHFWEPENYIKPGMVYFEKSE